MPDEKATQYPLVKLCLKHHDEIFLVLQKEKQQGYARNSRQRAVAMVIKESQAIGLNARKAIMLNQEELTRSSLTEVMQERGMANPVRNCAGGRNACIRKAVIPNDQLSVATHKHLCHKKLANWEETFETLTCRAKALRRLQSNIKAGWVVDHERLALLWENIKMQTAELLRFTNAMQSRIANVPEPEVSIGEPNTCEHPLSRLHSQSPELENLQKNVAEANVVCREMHAIATQ
ncbi:unnamed protein product, partial [Strongylus vulgaris]